MCTYKLTKKATTNINQKGMPTDAEILYFYFRISYANVIDYLCNVSNLRRTEAALHYHPSGASIFRFIMTFIYEGRCM